VLICEPGVGTNAIVEGCPTLVNVMCASALAEPPS